MPALDIETTATQLCSEIQVLLSLKPGSVVPETNLAGLGIDSLRFVSLMILIEQKFGVSLMKGGLKQHEMQSARALATAICGRRND